VTQGRAHGSSVGGVDDEAESSCAAGPASTARIPAPPPFDRAHREIYTDRATRARCCMSGLWSSCLLLASAGLVGCAGKPSQPAAEPDCGAIYDRISAIDPRFGEVVVKVPFVLTCEVDWYDAVRRCYSEIADADDI